MTVYGLIATGFLPKTIEIIRDEMNAELRASLGASLDLSDQDPLGQLVGIVAAAAGELWELGEAINASGNRDTATGAALDNVLLLTGTFRAEESSSTVTLTLTGTATTAIAAGSQVETLSTGIVFATDDDAIIAAATAWSNATYAVGDKRTNTTRIYVCITAGTSTVAPTGTSADSAPGGTAHWRYLGEGAGFVDVDATAVVVGASVAVSGDITVITTPIGGWSSVMNISSAALGSAEATDEEARIAGEADLATAGESTANAIRQELLAVTDVDSVTLFVNNTDITDADGVPPHSVEALVRGGANQDIWDALYNVVSATSGTHGTVDGTATDTEGVTHAMSFSRPTEKTAFVKITLVYDALLYPADGDQQVRDAIADWGNAQSCGKNIVAAGAAAQAFTVAGVIDVTETFVKKDSGPATSAVTVQISTRELAVYIADDTNIDVTSSAGTP